MELQKIDIRECEYRSGTAGGSMVSFEVIMDPYPDRRTRTVKVLLPRDYDGVKRFPVLYMHDGQMTFPGEPGQKWEIERALAKLSWEGLSLIVVGVYTSPHRGSELCPDCTPTENHFFLKGEDPTGDLYARFIVETLKPAVDANFMTLQGPENTGIGGASMGGMISHYIALKYPEVFGRALIFSPAFSFIDWDEVLERVKKADLEKARNNRYYIMSGGDTVERNLHTLCSSVRCYESLIDLGVDERNVVLFTDSRLRHHEVSWGEVFPDAVRFLFH